MKEPEYRRLRRKIEAEYQEKLKALDMVFRMSGGAATKNDSPGGREMKGAVPQAVRTALQNIAGDFTVRDVEKQIKIDDPTSAFKRASISSTLKRLTVDRKIVCVVEGRGKRASKYRITP